MVNRAQPQKARRSTNQRATEKRQEQSATSLQADFLTTQQLLAHPASASAQEIQALQHTVGNQATTHFIQAKLHVGPAGDRYEREADRVAQQVITTPELSSRPQAQRQERDTEDLQMKPGLQRQEMEEEEVQMKSASGGGFALPSNLEARLENQKGGGIPLPNSTRDFMEPRFGADFSAVRVHTGGEATQISRQINAKAFTHGQDIYFGGGAFQPKTDGGKRLLAHELTHVLQQTGNKTPSVQRLFGRKKKQPAPAQPQQVPDAFFEESWQAWQTGQISENMKVTPEQRQQIENQRKEQRIKTAVAGLKAELKGHTGFFRTKRKTQAAMEKQGGVLDQAQLGWINTLAGLAPEQLTGLGFLLPDQVAAYARQKMDVFGDRKKTEAWEKRVGKLPIKQQMQIRTYVDQMEVSQPTAAPSPEREAAQEKSRTIFETAFTGGKGQDFSALAQEATQKREEMGFTPASTSRPSRAPSEGPSSEDLVLKPGKVGEETMTHSVDKYRDEAANYVEQAGIDQATIGQTAEMLITDYVDVREGEQRYNEVARKKEMAEQALQAADTLTPKERKQFGAQVKWADEQMNALLKALHESDFGKATEDARSRAEAAQAAAGVASQEKATIEYLYDEVEKKKAEVKQRKSSATRKQKKDSDFNAQTAQMEKSAADTAKDLTQQAKMSFDVIRVRRRSTDEMKEHVQKNLDRFAGKARKIGTKAAAGSLNAIVGIATMGLVGAKENTTIKGYTGKGLEKKGWPVKATFLNDIRNQLAQFRNTVKARPSGPSALDVTSALLRGFNEIVVQNVINISGKLALITGVLATLLTAATAVTFGGTAPAAGVLATISSIATFVALIAAALKATVSMARITIDGLAALLNQDAKMRNVLKSRAKQAGLETVTDATQAATLAVGLPTSEVIKGNDFFNMFDPSEIIKVKTGMVTNQATSSSLSDTARSIAGPTTSAAMTVGGPLLTGPVTQGVVAAVDDPYGLHTQHPDEMGMAPPTRAGGGFLPPSKQRARLEAQSKPNKQGDAPVDTTMPTWMQTEMEKQNRLRAKAYQERTAVGVGQIAAINEKATKMADKLRVGKNRSDELDTQLEASKSKGNDQIDNESLEMSRQQSGVLDASAGTITETVAALRHSQREMKQLAEQRS